MTSERVAFCLRTCHQGLYSGPDGIYHFRIERAHDVWSLHLVVGGLGKHPDSLGANHHDRWMVTYPPRPLNLVKRILNRRA